MFNRAIEGQFLPKNLSSDNDPLFRFGRCLEIDNSAPMVVVLHESQFGEDVHNDARHRFGGLTKRMYEREWRAAMISQEMVLF